MQCNVNNLCPKLILHNDLLLNLTHAIPRNLVKEFELPWQFVRCELGAQFVPEIAEIQGWARSDDTRRDLL